MVISITSYLLGRAIFSFNKTTVSKALLTVSLLLVYSPSEILLYNMLVNREGMTVKQYIANSAIIVIMFVALPMLLARPNKHLLKLTAKVHKGF